MSITNTFIFAWKIANYSKLYQKVYNYFQSGTFVTEYYVREEWHLKFYSNGWLQNTDEVWCFLSRNASNRITTVDITLQLIDPAEKVLMSKEMKNKTYEVNDEWGVSLTTIGHLKNEGKTWKEDVLTIRCFLSIKNLNLKENLFYDYETKMKIGTNLNTFTWCINEPDSLEWSARKLFICSEVISMEVILTAPGDNIIVVVKNKSIVLESFSVSCKITLLDATGVEKFSVTDKHIFDNIYSNSLWNFTLFTKTDLNEKHCIQNSLFILIIEFIVPNGIVTTEDKNGIKYYNSHPKLIESIDVTTTLQNDLKKMYLDKKHTDIRLKVDDDIFYAHKCILSSRSPVFQAMFNCEMLENKYNAVNITDLDSATLRNFLQFLYNGTVDANTCETVLKLMIAADKYQVETLTQKCAQMLMSFLTEKSACEIIAVADMVNHKILKTSVLEVIERHAITIFSSEDWVRWAEQNIDLASEIFYRVAPKIVHRDN